MSHPAHLHRKAHFMAFITAVFWSLSFVCIREILNQFQEHGASVWQASLALFQMRMSLTALAYLPHVWMERHHIASFTIGDWKRVGLITFTISFGYHLTLNMGAQSIPSGFVSLIVAMSPIFSALLARLILKERLGLPRISAILLGLTGILICLVAQNRLNFETLVSSWPGLLGPALVMFSAVDGALFAIVGRRTRPNIPVGLKLGLAMLGTSLLALPLWNLTMIHLVLHLDVWGWMALFYLVIPCTYLASMLWYSSLKVLETVQVTIYLNATTLLALAWGALFFREEIRPLYGVGAVCILCAVVLAGRGRNQLKKTDYPH